ncbi:YaaR family protein [Halobacillus salinarum]|uniref:YaaR family protein n=1 Tax=Halobacillus salinarum TaxID=2932257 RepID=A0ABY4EJQ2_9BACI|nr:YaaR family protein [Halobacillus salinarum]UOQ44692.1 YaaR family protein [Halobacillus salinarum]
MKISQEMRTQLDSANKQAAKQMKSSQNFGRMVQTQSRQLHETQLNQLFAGIALQGERVAKVRSFRDLARYKRMIKEFVKESVQYGMHLKHSHSWNMQGQTRKLTIVESVDDKLNELTEALMDQERKSIDLLGIIGEIKGLLINLYT